MTERVALITGGSAGIGLATAEQLAAEGWRVVLAARRQDRLDQARERLGDHATTLRVDLSDTAAVRAMVRDAIRSFGRLDALVNNAGLAPLKPIDETDDATLEAAYRVNALAPAAAISEAWPTLKAQRSGVVVNVSTVGTDDPFPGFFAYAASKAAVNLMARSAANEGAEFGIRAFSVAPGAVETAMLRGLFSTDIIPEHDALAPADVARVIVDCIEGRRDQDNGSTIRVERQAPPSGAER
ncbi:MAG: SDR family oxidoreductase [Planctomycetota bacterium]